MLRHTYEHRPFAEASSLNANYRKRHWTHMNKTKFCIAITGVCLSSCISYGNESEFLSQGSYVHVSAKPEFSSKTIPDVPGFEKVLDSIAIKSRSSSPLSFIVSGRVVSANTGTPLEFIPVSVGDERESPKLAAMTNVDGEFKFRLWVKIDHRNSKIQMKPHLDSYLYIGGDISVNQSGEIRLGDSNSRRYPMYKLTADAEQSPSSEQKQQQEEKQPNLLSIKGKEFLSFAAREIRSDLLRTEVSDWPGKSLDAKKRIRQYLYSLGISSTGHVQLIGTYRLTEDSKFGEEGDLVFHFLQRDLFGARLFWSCLVNVDSELTSVLYDVQQDKNELPYVRLPALKSPRKTGK